MTKQSIEMDQAAAVLKLLGDKTRLTIMRILADQDCCVCEFVAIFEASQPAISQHIRKLKDAGLVKESRRGQWIFYSLNRQYEHFEFVQLLLDALPSQEEKLLDLEKQGKRISCE
ncbi:winged helix-turn-helix transcriptional regulator [Bacillus sp. ISL-35]|uniref:ArsR/SmtB family transcription factor n=1 Tax=Bacillus sp. ISL-35 TaxID=2819122 RepID=UPI001BE8043C|nr:metalloregulator ArsR/SmtB family transcription factor [Bacillus sp. ISL-35]MBT2679859.1 winged helix-turn-helix transcriptional regulator [Bacillus sp. ISL-35]MBT2704894.1 winged helix-turn-helix transcriptional regulator [Chryseobacterium sp. ISL-80]